MSFITEITAAMEKAAKNIDDNEGRTKSTPAKKSTRGKVSTSIRYARRGIISARFASKISRSGKGKYSLRGSGERRKRPAGRFLRSRSVWSSSRRAQRTGSRDET